MNRKGFIRKACITGACACGFSKVLLTAGSLTERPLEATGDEIADDLLRKEFISALLESMNAGMDKEEIRGIVKKCSSVHYSNLNMDDLLKPYIGDLYGFTKFLEEKWGWKVFWSVETKSLVADENKDHCVCPLNHAGNNKQSAILCYCSEGFAEKMFGTIAGKPVSATVISSVLRGDRSCRYRVDLT